MNKMIGIWVDHRKAVLVAIEDGSTTVSRVESAVGTRFHPSGGWKAGGTSVAQSIVKEQTENERRKHQLHAFYQEVIKTIGKAAGIFIFGPGEARHELAKEIEKIKGPHARIFAIEACDKLTEPLIVAKVKTFFKG